MLTYLRTNLFESPSQTLVNTVNTEGVMGKGIAKQFRNRFPEMFKEYKSACESGELEIGRLHIWRGNTRWILNFPTKTRWRLPSKIEYIRIGLERFVDTYQEQGVSSASFPPLGCGNGGLNWDDVKPLMEYYLSKCDIPIYIHERHVNKDFIPEHMEAEDATAPDSFSEFLDDIGEVIYKREGLFHTISNNTIFKANKIGSNLEFVSQKRRDFLDEDEIYRVWSVLRRSLLTSDQYSGEGPKRAKSYIFSVLAELPYVQLAEFQHARKNRAYGYALFFRKDMESDSLLPKENSKQFALWE